MTHASFLSWAFLKVSRASLFKFCRCKQYAHSQPQWELLWAAFKNTEFHLIGRSYLPAFLASQSNRANNPWVSLEHKARVFKGRNGTMTGCTKRNHQCVRKSPLMIAICALNVVCKRKRRDTIPFLLLLLAQVRCQGLLFSPDKKKDTKEDFLLVKITQLYFSDFSLL